jgi:hypothetical protein
MLTEWAVAWRRAPAMKSRDARRITGLRPVDEARRPVRGLAMSAKREVELVIRLLSRVVRGRARSEGPMEMRVEEMTPVLGGVSGGLEYGAYECWGRHTHIQTTTH